jgi:hypothetical protein
LWLNRRKEKEASGLILIKRGKDMAGVQKDIASAVGRLFRTLEF